MSLNEISFLCIDEPMRRDLSAQNFLWRGYKVDYRSLMAKTFFEGPMVLEKIEGY